MAVPGGRRQKTDRRDAELIARLLRAGELTGIQIPDPVDESIRDLARARSDAVDEQTRAKQRLKSFLLRSGYRYKGSANWSEKHRRYLRGLSLPLPAHKAVLEEYLRSLDRSGASTRPCRRSWPCGVSSWWPPRCWWPRPATSGASSIRAT